MAAAGSRRTRSRSRSSRRTARSTCSPTPSAQHRDVLQPLRRAHAPAAPVQRARARRAAGRTSCADGRRRVPAAVPRAARSGGCAPSTGSRASATTTATDTNECGALPARGDRPGALLPHRRRAELAHAGGGGYAARGGPGHARHQRAAAAGADAAAGVHRDHARRRPVRRRAPASATTRPGRTAARAAGIATTGRATRFGELGETAQTRRAMLERLVPRLKIADRCTVDGTLPRGARRPAHLQDPPRQRQHPDGAERPVPVHRPGAARRRRPAPSSSSRSRATHLPSS